MDIPKDKFILDACCGMRMMWFDKTQKNTIFIDNKQTDVAKPDIIMDFTNLQFSDKSFKLVVWDPPHLKSFSEKSLMVKKFGWLTPETWPDILEKGFKECFRVLEDYGILIFKWNDHDIPLKKLLLHFHTKPLFGTKSKHASKTGSSTYWFCFMKIP